MNRDELKSKAKRRSPAVRVLGRLAGPDGKAVVVRMRKVATGDHVLVFRPLCSRQVKTMSLSEIWGIAGDQFQPLLRGVANLYPVTAAPVKFNAA